MISKWCGIVGVVAMLSCAVASAAQSSTGEVTYQGVLTQSGSPVPDGAYRLVFKVYDAASGGNLIETITVPGVQTTQGRFAALMPVTPSTFNGADRWWSVTFAETELPRQKVTAAPYSVFADTAAAATRLHYADDSSLTQNIPIDGNLITTGGLALNLAARSELALFDAMQREKWDGRAVARLVYQIPGDDATVWLNYRHASEPNLVDMLRCDSGTDTQFVVQHIAGTSPRIRIGIGTASPQSARLHVVQPFNFNFATARFGATTVQGVPANVFVNYMNSDGTLDLIRANVSGPDEAMRVRADGRTEVLDLSCRVLTIRGADLAERFDVASANLPLPESGDSPAVKAIPGMVVSIDPTNPGKLIVASASYDQRVAGVISGANGLNVGVVLGQGNADPLIDGEHPVAMTGRVWVYADESNGKISPGHRLTTSGMKPGHAMRATDASQADGAVIGKAMTGVDPNTGMCLVLVNLQ